MMRAVFLTDAEVAALSKVAQNSAIAEGAWISLNDQTVAGYLAGLGLIHKHPQDVSPIPLYRVTAVGQLYFDMTNQSPESSHGKQD